MWTADELATVRETLLAQLRELRQATARLEAEVEGPPPGEGGLADGPIQQADLASRHADEDIALGVLAVEGRLQTDIVDALARIDQNRYGTCEKCGGGITKPRLRALPSARHCMKCVTDAPGR